MCIRDRNRRRVQGFCSLSPETSELGSWVTAQYMCCGFDPLCKPSLSLTVESPPCNLVALATSLPPPVISCACVGITPGAVSYTHLRAHETVLSRMPSSA
eukprot:TRINITY_DN34409_c0_g1_i1.p1 TRINITY_DN34409_c0_g1~~TRINITY_DN34409_c0_g1_i1.p1  ORF type:complete len:100 (-),score=10.90 TRINITY_DN34409_c0_g1_i1:76-375(-)